MMEFVNALPTWALAGAIFSLRIVASSIGTIRVISIVRGRITQSVVLGFFEILIWLGVVSTVVLNVREEPVLMVAYAVGFAAGSALGMILERKMALGSSVALMISREKGLEIARELRGMGQRLTTIQGEGRDGPRVLLYVTAARRDLSKIIETAKSVDPDLFHVIDHCSETSYTAQLSEPAFGWRSFLKFK